MLTRWKILACSLTVGVGGLAVFATPPADVQKDAPPSPPPLPKLTVKPDSPPNGADTPAPPPGAKPGPGLEFDLDLPPIAPPKPPAAKPPEPIPVFEDLIPAPPVVLPVKGEADDKKLLPKVEVALPPITELKTPAPPLPPIKPIELPKPVPLPEAPRPVVAEPEPPRIPAPLAPSPAVKGEAAKLKMLLRMGDGNPRFEIRNTATTELLLKVYGEKIELQAPTAAKSSVAGVSATGKVRFTAPGIEGSCDTLKILSATGEVLLEGHIQLKSKGGKAWSELTAERMVYQIGNAGLVAPKPTVRPVGFLPE